MNILQFFKDVETSFNENSKCGECWVFKSPLSEAGMNASKFTEEESCCVKMFLTYYNYQSGFVRSPTTQLQQTGYCDYYFTLYVVKDSNLGINVLNEEPGHEEIQSLWSTILSPLMDCLGCGNEFDLCDLGYNFDILRWSMNPVILKHDSNYTGWKIDGTFRQYK